MDVANTHEHRYEFKNFTVVTVQVFEKAPKSWENLLMLQPYTGNATDLKTQRLWLEEFLKKLGKHGKLLMLQRHTGTASDFRTLFVTCRVLEKTQNSWKIIDVANIHDGVKSRYVVSVHVVKKLIKCGKTTNFSNITRARLWI